MRLPKPLKHFTESEDGAVLVLWSLALVVFLGLLGVIFDIGRLGTTQSELQSYADSISLAAAAELDGDADALTRARAAADNLIFDTQTYAEGDKILSGPKDVTLIFYQPGPDGRFARDAALVTTNPYRARFVEARIDNHKVAPGLGAAFAALSDAPELSGEVSAYAVSGFSLEACNVAPVAMCLPSVEFDARSAIGSTLELEASVDVTQLVPGQITAFHSLTNALDGLTVCAGLLGGDLEACLLAARQPETACTGQGGLVLSTSLDGNDVMDALNTRFDTFSGVASQFTANPLFSAAPNILTGMTSSGGACGLMSGQIDTSLEDYALPADDCIETGACGIMGDGNWDTGRAAYVEAYYQGEEPFPAAKTRFEFYQKEIATYADGGLALTADQLLDLLGGQGGLLGLVGNQQQADFCAPQQNMDPSRRLMVIAGIDCSSGAVDATVSAPPVQEFFEVFTLGPVRDGKLKVEISACLGGDCGKGNLDTEIHDIIRLVE